MVLSILFGRHCCLSGKKLAFLRSRACYRSQLPNTGQLRLACAPANCLRRFRRNASLHHLPLQLDRERPLGGVATGSVWEQIKSLDKLNDEIGGDLANLVILHDPDRWQGLPVEKLVEGWKIVRVAMA